NSAAGAVWTVNGKINAGGIVVQQGGLIARGTTLNLSRLNAISAAAKEIDISNTVVSGLTESIINGANLTLNTGGTTINLVNAGAATLDWTGVDFDGILNTRGSTATISGGASIESLSIAG